jgi:hypothetical protein
MSPAIALRYRCNRTLPCGYFYAQGWLPRTYSLLRDVHITCYFGRTRAMDANCNSDSAVTAALHQTPDCTQDIPPCSDGRATYARLYRGLYRCDAHWPCRIHGGRRYGSSLLQAGGYLPFTLSGIPARIHSRRLRAGITGCGANIGNMFSASHVAAYQVSSLPWIWLPAVAVPHRHSGAELPSLDTFTPRRTIQPPHPYRVSRFHFATAAPRPGLLPGLYITAVTTPLMRFFAGWFLPDCHHVLLGCVVRDIRRRIIWTSHRASCWNTDIGAGAQDCAAGAAGRCGAVGLPQALYFARDCAGRTGARAIPFSTFHSTPSTYFICAAEIARLPPSRSCLGVRSSPYGLSSSPVAIFPCCLHCLLPSVSYVRTLLPGDYLPAACARGRFRSSRTCCRTLCSRLSR